RKYDGYRRTRFDRVQSRWIVDRLEGARERVRLLEQAKGRQTCYLTAHRLCGHVEGHRDVLPSAARVVKQLDVIVINELALLPRKTELHRSGERGVCTNIVVDGRSTELEPGGRRGRATARCGRCSHRGGSRGRDRTVNDCNRVSRCTT